MTALRPQPGPQEAILACAADIAVFGGSAGCGKTWGLLAEPVRHVANRDFTAVIFRKHSTQVRNPGGLWDGSMRIYPLAGGGPRETALEWSFPSGCVIKFSHLEHETTKLEWQGSEIAFIGFDELTHFSEATFWYMLSRNRSTCGVRPYVRATCNAEADSWVADLVAWWINQKTGYPIPERSGVVRWFIRLDNRLIWADDPSELRDISPGSRPKSFTFIPGTLDDNPILERLDPEYRGNLMALPLVEREQLLGGNWKIRRVAGMYFQEPWFQTVSAAPRQMRKLVRYWDKAAGVTDAADFTAGVLMGAYDGLYYVLDVRHGRWSPFERNKVIAETAEADDLTYGRHVVQLWIENEGRGSGKESAMISVRELAKYGCRLDPVREDKELRSRPFSAQCEAGNVRLLRARWNRDYIDELTAFPNPKVHDDQCLIAGTLVETHRGAVPIEDVVAGDRVVTRSGLMRVEWSGVTGVRPVWTLETDVGAAICGTADHPVWIEGRGFVAINAVHSGDEVLLWNELSKPLSTTDGFTGATHNRRGGLIASTSSRMRIGDGRRFSSIAPFGKSRTDQFRQAVSFITRMATRSTMISRTLNASLLANAFASMLREAISQLQALFETSIESAILQASGIVLQRGGNGIGSTRCEWQSVRLPTRITCAESAAQHSCRSDKAQRCAAVHAKSLCAFASHGTVGGVNSVSETLCLSAVKRGFAPARVRRIIDTGRTEAVYNLAIADCHEYVANGVLVHNCDASSGAFNKLVVSGGSKGGGISGRPRAVLLGAGQGRWN